MLQRAVEKEINQYLQDRNNKILFIWGPRRSGKTTLLKKISAEHNVPVFNFDLLSDRVFFVPKKEILAKLVKEQNLILIDEVQNYPESTIPLKILHDEFNVKVIATGSSELRKKSQNFDTLTGRFNEIYCLPLNIEEIIINQSPKEYEKNAFVQNISGQIQIFGSYPEVFTLKKDDTVKTDILENIVDTFVVKDIVNIYQLKNARLAKDILTKIALQTGSEVSFREIANSLETNVTTVTNNIEIFVKNYILISLPSFKINSRRAISEHKKLFFYDLGIRNTLVKDFRSLDLRPDKGGVFENFIVSEIEKIRQIHNLKMNLYFYREYSGKEVDLVLEDYKKNYFCLEIKIKNKKVRKVFPLPHRFDSISLENFLEILDIIKQFASI